MNSCETMPTETEKSPVIEMHQVMKSFGTQRVLEDINLDICPGEIMVVMGGSGCGKSTLLRLLIGSLEPDRGRRYGELRSPRCTRSSDRT